MPTTVNGIGTHYYGKSSRSVRGGVCRSCGASTNLESYDTTLWFVVIFIPLIPLGRKRIIDQCPRCSRHFVADRKKFESARQENVSAALEKYRSQPSPEAALAMHGSLLSFQLHQEADKFRESALLDHPQSAELRVGLASHMSQMGRGDESTRLLASAYDLRPDLPDARAGAARLRIREGRLREARELLDFLERPGAGQQYSLGPLEMLAIAYQKAGEHDQTLVLCKHLIRELPKIGQIASFRRLVTTSERAMGIRESILPGKSFSLADFFGVSNEEGKWRRRLTWAAVIVGAALLVVAGLNEYWRRHRTVVAMNECGQPVQMAIDGGPATPVDHTARLELAEGQHHVKVSGPINDEFDIDMATGYFERFTKKPAWVIMPGAGTVLEEETIHYSIAPRPSETKFISGKNFYYAPDIDYCFTTPPHQLQVENRSTELTKTFLHAATEPAHLLMAVTAAEDISAGLRFGETRLMGSRDDVQLLDMYAHLADSAKQADRARVFLKQGLNRQPISVPWHRAYQDVAKLGDGQAVVEKEYDDLLKKTPRDARMLYLAGRVAADRRKANRLFRESLEADPNLPWPCIALAYAAGSNGDWQTCRSMDEKALEHIDYPGAAALVRYARLALGDYAKLEQEYRDKLTERIGNRQNVGTEMLLDLYEVRLLQGHGGNAQAAMAEWAGPSPFSPGEEERCRLWIDYMNGDFSAPPIAGSNGESKFNDDIRLQSLLAGGRVKDALADSSLEKLLDEPAMALQASIAWHLAGNSAEADKWREKAAAVMEQGDIEMKRAGAMLRAANPPTASQLDDVVQPPPEKCLLVAALMQRFPQHKAELAPIARKLNVGRKPPYQLVRQVLEDSSARKAKAEASAP
jgi:tetratricopeptide (TPR) repeat protein